MDKGYIDRLKTELLAAQTILDQAAEDRRRAKKEYAAKDETWITAQIKVDTVKNMLISAYEA